MGQAERRTLISRTAVSIIARHGTKALTHRAVDRELGLPNGSTSYYFRTRDALIEATALFIVDRSRSTYDLLADTHSDIAGLTAAYLDDLLSNRSDELTARYALLLETRENAILHSLLVKCLFSTDKARALFPDRNLDENNTPAEDFVSLLEGLIFDRSIGARSAGDATDNIRDLRVPIQAYLDGIHRDAGSSPE
ncbi:AcrR family transcriptional regulator [Rhodococcus sp. 27YEA15]|uniref:TetR/AcrR family transcriptional regulator n=1 Tax=Rhodococcus sp. 27YEA15 TaxID=3156259 RepID=UPI003C7E1686